MISQMMRSGFFLDRLLNTHFAVFRGGYFVAGQLQYLGGIVPDFVVVFNKQ